MILLPLYKRYSRRFISHWLVLAMETLLVAFLYPVAALIRYNFQLNEMNASNTAVKTGIITVLYLIAFLILASYRGIIRQTGLKDTKLITVTVILGSSFGFLLNQFNFIWSALEIPKFAAGVLLIHMLLSGVFIILMRFFIKSIYIIFVDKYSRKITIPVLIYGSGFTGEITRQSLEKEQKNKFKLIAFIDDNPSKQGKKLNGVPVISMDKAFTPEFIQKWGIQQAIIAIDRLRSEKKEIFIEKALALGLQTRIVPPSEQWMQHDLSIKQIKAVNIEDLLGRAPIRLTNPELKSAIAQKVVLVTGAAGSIGSEISRQLLKYEPACLLLVDQAESALYDLQMELSSHPDHLFKQCHFIICDIGNVSRMKEIFEQLRRELVYHAAAYKHVPMMEAYPDEAARLNILGTRKMVDLSLKYQVKKFVLVSTDKAVNPTNIMGASKRIAEMYVQAQNQYLHCETQFITTRFGNVLGSNGSVVPLFRAQIEKGGPVTVTHPQITRYFMTIPEACNLVLEAGSMGTGGEIFIFDMGKPVRIYDLALKMIQLMGKDTGKGVQISFTGLRPGEKLTEELLSASENVKPTHHPKIMIAVSGDEMDYDQFLLNLDQLDTFVRNNERLNLVRAMKYILPQYVSNNSTYSTLDRPQN
ncbi:MAG: polysaccharide biosynthesis protein [Saprospiraceae bacterium]|nr:polysaccharide biosynthesis protein [Saprospiraceae bacterium]